MERKSGVRMLKAKNIGYHYSGKWLFRNVDLQIAGGEVVGLSGRSGTGKTTLAKVLAGYMKPAEGVIELCEESLERPTTKKAHPIQLIWQHAEQTINPRWKLSKLIEEAGASDSHLMEALHIEQQWLTRYPHELSAGQLQRLCLLRALLTNPSYILADEATAMLDTVTQLKLWKLLLKLAEERGIGILAISHDSYLLDRISARRFEFSELAR